MHSSISGYPSKKAPRETNCHLLISTIFQLVGDKLLNPLPEAKLVSTPDGLPNELFGDVAMITEFIWSYQGLFHSGCGSPIYAHELMEALVAGKNSFKVLSKLLVIFLHILLLDEVAKVCLARLKEPFLMIHFFIQLKVLFRVFAIFGIYLIYHTPAHIHH